MNKLDITGYKVTTLKVLGANVQALEKQIQALAGQRQELAATLWAELHEEGNRQGVDVPDGAGVDVQDDRVVVTWDDAPDSESGEAD